MITIENRLGKIIYSDKYLIKLVKDTVLSCYGISGLNTIQKRGLSFFKSKYLNDGIYIKKSSYTVKVDIHIKVMYGINVSEIVKSIKNKVGWAIKDNTGIFADEINVYVENLRG